MAKPAPTAEVILGILVDRVAGVPAEETAQKYGYKPNTLSTLAKRYDLEAIERQLRLQIIGQGAELSPEVIALNQKYEDRLRRIGDLMFAGAEQAETLRFETEVEKMRFLELAARGLEGTRQSRLKIAQAVSDGKKKREAATAKGDEDDGYKSAYADLANDDEDDDDEDS